LQLLDNFQILSINTNKTPHCCGVAHLCFEKIADKDDSTMTADGIKVLDAIGQFDESKEILAELGE
jgi:hypothetical protein